MESTLQNNTTANSASTVPASAAADLSTHFGRMQLLGEPQPQLELPVAAPPPPRQQYYQTQPPSSGVGERSTGAEFVSPYAFGNIYSTHFGAHSPRFNAAPGAPPTPVASQLPGAGASTEKLDPIARPNPSVPRPRSSSTSPGPIASHFQFQPTLTNPYLSAAASTSSAYWGDQGSNFNEPYAAASSSTSAYCVDHGSIFNDPYASAPQSTPPFANPMDYRSWFPTPPCCHPWLSTEEIRMYLLRRPVDPDLLMSPAISPHVASLLRDGDDAVRESVLDTLKCNVVCFIWSTAESQAILLELVRACKGRRDELQDIVHAVYRGNGLLSAVAKHNHGLKALKELITAVVPHPRLLNQLIVWLLREHLMEQSRGAELLEHCFITMPYDHSKILIWFATKHIIELLFSAFGSRCVSKCFVYARNDELRHLEKFILDYTSQIATGKYSNYFLQRVIESGRESLQVAIADRVAADLVNLSSEKFGSYVVESCFSHMRSPAPLQLVFNAVMALGGGDLTEMVRGRYSNYVISRLLDTAKGHMPEQAMALAQRIAGLIPPEVHSEMHASEVMAVVRKLIKRQPRFNYYY